MVITINDVKGEGFESGLQWGGREGLNDDAWSWLVISLGQHDDEGLFSFLMVSVMSAKTIHQCSSVVAALWPAECWYYSLIHRAIVELL